MRIIASIFTFLLISCCMRIAYSDSCDPHQYQTNDGLGCFECSDESHYSPGGTATQCLTCEEVKHSADTSFSKWKSFCSQNNCKDNSHPVQNFNLSDGASIEKVIQCGCKSGYQTNSSSSSDFESEYPSCEMCKAGEYSDQSLLGCIKCSRGSYSLAGASACSECLDGFFSNTTGLSSCYRCPQNSISHGTYCTCSLKNQAINAQQDACVDICDSTAVYDPNAFYGLCYCPASTYINPSNPKACLQCPPNTYSDINAKECKTCNGRIVDNECYRDRVQDSSSPDDSPTPSYYYWAPVLAASLIGIFVRIFLYSWCINRFRSRAAVQYQPIPGNNSQEPYTPYQPNP